jgi:hypothetical protein
LIVGLLVVCSIGLMLVIVRGSPPTGRITRAAVVRQHVFARRANTGDTAKFVPPTPDGYVAEARNPLSDVTTGPQLLAQATSEICDGVSESDLKGDQWIASDLHYWTGVERSNTKTYVTLCLSELGSNQNAETNLQQIAGDFSVSPYTSGPNLSPIRIAEIPGSIGATTRNGLVRLVFAKSQFVVFVAAGGTSNAGVAPLTSLAAEVAESEYNELPAT